MKSIFDEARSAVSASLIQQMLETNGAYWDAGEYWTRNPLRADGTVGSFSISETGVWHDFADDTGGDLIDLIVDMRKCSKKEAAEEIVRMGGHYVAEDTRQSRETSKKEKQRDKFPPQIPAPEAALKSLNQAMRADWARDRYGEPLKGWTYRDADARVVFCVVRYEKKKPDGTIAKDVVPFYYGIDERWHNGSPLDTGRPLFKLDQVSRADRSVPVLVVEGEKCASVEVPGYLVVTWSQGTASVLKTDWSPLEGREIIIWPDADHQYDKAGKLIPWHEQPGMKAALTIAKRLPGARILDVQSKAAQKNGWDIADAVSDGVDPVAFIADTLPQVAGETGRSDDALPFVVLGHDTASHYFMRRDSRVIFAVGRGSFNAIKALEIAPLSYWAIDFSSKTDGIRAVDIYDFLINLSADAGSFDHTKVRGAGVWRDKDGIVLNDGQRLIMPDGTVRAYDEHRSEFVYIKSSVKFGAMAGPEATDEDGAQLEELFKAQSWTDPAMATLAMGWALIAPFGGMLKWRPHIWLTGRKGSGKSYMLENLIAPLCGPFAHRGSGKDTEAGIRRSLNMDARPVILDEMEPKSAKAREKIGSLLELARNASSDGSGVITIGGGVDGGAVTFVIRSCFAFASVQVPDEDAAVASRIIRMELRAETDQAAKFRRCAELYAECMQDPSRYTRRMYRALPRILSDVEFIRSAYLGIFGEQRRVDQVAPLFAAAWAAQSSSTIRDSDAGREWLSGWLDRLVASSGESVEDEDAVVRHLIAAQVRNDDGKTRTVAEWMNGVILNGEEGAEANLLSRNGIRLMDYEGKRVVAIAADNQHVRKILTGTAYESGYGAQLRRNKLCVKDSHTVRFACGCLRACLIDWTGFKKQYIGETVIAQPALADDTIPF